MEVSTLLFRKRLLDVGSGQSLIVPLAEGHLVLFANNLTITPETLLDDLTLATFVGYTAVTAPVWSVAFQDPQGAMAITAPSKTWIATAATPVNTIYGWAITDEDDTGLLIASLFPLPIVIDAVGKGVTAQPLFRYGR